MVVLKEAFFKGLPFGVAIPLSQVLIFFIHKLQGREFPDYPYIVKSPKVLIIAFASGIVGSTVMQLIMHYYW